MLVECGAVVEVWRYPVKSFLGERLPSASLDGRGLVGDRLFAVADARGKLGSGKTTRRFRLLKGLFELEARTSDDGAVVSLPDGRELRVGSPELDEAVSVRYGEPLRVAREGAVPHFDVAGVHIVTTASLRWLAARMGGAELAARRFRPNLLVDAPGASLLEEAWVGAEVRVGTCVLRVTSTTERCVMVNNAQRELRADPGVLRGLVRVNDARLGVYAEVVSPGIVREGDRVDVRP